MPGVPLPGDDARLDEAELERQAAILQAAWAALETAATRHATDELRRGPRGGGRDLAGSSPMSRMRTAAT